MCVAVRVVFVDAVPLRRGASDGGIKKRARKIILSWHKAIPRLGKRRSCVTALPALAVCRPYAHRRHVEFFRLSWTAPNSRSIGSSPPVWNDTAKYAAGHDMCTEVCLCDLASGRAVLSLENSLCTMANMTRIF